MVNAKFSMNADRLDPEVQLALAYVPASQRSRIEAIWALDAQFAAVVRSTTEPLIGEMRLTWWHDAVKALGSGSAPDEPLLQRLLIDLGNTSADFPALAAMADGWSALLEPMPLDSDALDLFADNRGGAVFAQIGALLGAPDFAAVHAAGAGWALADFAFRCSDRGTAQRALGMAKDRLVPALAGRWPTALRPLGIVAHLALRDAMAGLETPRRQGSPGRILVAIRHRLTGR